MSPAAKGFLGGFLTVVGFFGVKEAVEEYRYYQQVKKEHQAFLQYQFGEIGKLPNGQSFSRAAFLDALLKEAVKAQKK